MQILFIVMVTAALREQKKEIVAGVYIQYVYLGVYKDTYG